MSKKKEVEHNKNSKKWQKKKIIIIIKINDDGDTQYIILKACENGIKVYTPKIE